MKNTWPTLNQAMAQVFAIWAHERRMERIAKIVAHFKPLIQAEEKAKEESKTITQ